MDKQEMKLELSIGLTSNPRTWPVIDGRVAPDGIDLVPTVLHPSELFWRQLRYSEFDVSEMSVSSLLMARSKGDERFVGIPVFTTRRFFHTTTLVRRDAKIDAPADLKGKRVGVPEYQQTAALWSRGVLQHEFGVHPKDMEFWMERPPSRSHGGATGFKPPPGVTVNQIPVEKSIGSMMVAGELDAVIFYLVDPNLIDRSTIDLHHHPDIKPLFPDPRAEGVRFFRKTGLYPINHGMVIKRELAEKHPWALTNILKAFNRANEIAERQRAEHVEYHIETGLVPAEAGKALQTPIISHGIIANRLVLETIAQYSNEQGLTPRVLKLDELFAANMMAQ
jgi:4,5-dihydroxyphthalate decarboxylase